MCCVIFQTTDGMQDLSVSHQLRKCCVLRIYSLYTDETIENNGITISISKSMDFNKLHYRIL
jgi:hypothetical protein